MPLRRMRRCESGIVKTVAAQRASGQVGTGAPLARSRIIGSRKAGPHLNTRTRRPARRWQRASAAVTMVLPFPDAPRLTGTPLPFDRSPAFAPPCRRRLRICPCRYRSGLAAIPCRMWLRRSWHRPRPCVFWRSCDGRPSSRSFGRSGKHGGPRRGQQGIGDGGDAAP